VRGAVANLGRHVSHGWVRTAVVGGVVAGIVGGALLTLAGVAVSIGVYLTATFLFGSWHGAPARIARGEIWAALKLPAYPLVGTRALGPDFDAPAVLLGVATHLVFWSCCGAIFGLIAHGRPWHATVALGVLTGMVLWTADSYVMPPSSGRLVELIPSGLALAVTFLWYERHHPPREA
jgi:hypothetical protein